MLQVLFQLVMVFLTSTALTRRLYWAPLPVLLNAGASLLSNALCWCLLALGFCIVAELGDGHHSSLREKSLYLRGDLFPRNLIGISSEHL